MFLRHFLCSSLVNLLLLASLEKRSTYRKFDCFLEAGNRDGLKEDNLVDKATGDVFTLLWEAMVLPVVKAFSCFQE